MARFQSTAAFVVDGIRRKAGTIYADTGANALPGDIVWLGLNSSKMSPALIPLDGTAMSMKASSVYAGIDNPRPDGANSVTA